MTRARKSSAPFLFLGILMLSACASPVVYKPEVEAFQRATAETSAFMEAKRASIRDIRSNLRTEELAAKTPLLRLSKACTKTLEKYASLAQADADPPLTAADVSGCELVLHGENDPNLATLINPPKVLDNSAAFVASVSAYAESLTKVATAGDQQSFVAAVNDLANTTTSVATSAAKAANKEPPDLEALAPIGNLVALAVSYYLENRRAEALKAGAKEAHKWIVQGSAAVAQAMYAAQFEIINAKQRELVNQLNNKVNELRGASYVAAADKAIVMGTDLRRELAADPGAPFRELPLAHEKLLDAFGDRERLLAASIAASKELFEAAKDAKNALVSD